ncbi:MAG: hypothetical protein WDW38_006914 [Sanguina aurantia]
MLTGNLHGRYLTSKQAVTRLSPGARKRTHVCRTGNGSEAMPHTDRQSLAQRHAIVLKYFPSAMGVDDLMGRVEMALAGFGFTGDNSIAMTNLCRDEVTAVLKEKIESVFGSSFNTNGLGGVLTCGVTGLSAGLSHSPICNGGRERYVFFSFPHIAIDSSGTMGAITRPGRAKQSCACGALLKCLGELRSEGLEPSCKVPGVHDPLEPEYSILKQRLARRLRYEKIDVAQMDLPCLTKVAERTITDDLEYLIEKTVNPANADYAVIVGIQVHNWAAELVPDGEVSLEFVAPTKAYAVVNGVKTYIALSQVPSLSPRQLQMMSAQSLGGISPANIEPGMSGSVMSEIPLSYLVKKLGGGLGVAANSSSTNTTFGGSDALGWSTWQAQIHLPAHLHVERDHGAPTMDSLDPPEPEEQRPVHTSFLAPLGDSTQDNSSDVVDEPASSPHMAELRASD